MTYSRSRTQSKQKSQKRYKKKLLFMINGILLTAIVIAGALIWTANNNQEAGENKPGMSEAHSTPSPSGNSSAAPSPESTDDSLATPTSEEKASTPPGHEGDKISLALVGDILPAARVLELMNQNGYDYPYRKAKEILSAADITAGNLESSITTRGTAAENKQYLFRAPPETLPAIKEAGFDYLSLANNHSMDYGWEGLSDTMDSLDDIELQHSGSGNDDVEAFTPAYIERKGITVAFVSVTRVVPEPSWKADRNHAGVAEAYSPNRAVGAIKEAKKNADLVVVMVHWGEERSEKPIAHQTDLGHRFVDAGADLVVGSHPHVLQGIEAYKGKWIAYSLGNFVFSTTTSSKTSETGVLNAECDKAGACSLTFHPMFATNSQPAPMDPVKGKELLKRLSTLSIGAAVEEDGSIVADH
ncbi:CapA family protein [Cohnella sp.]|uniref:CapA family protein n=1 Tax=Cohnella sp. TaxID=1883426 RepID=UPI00356A76CA